MQSDRNLNEMLAAIAIVKDVERAKSDHIVVCVLGKDNRLDGTITTVRVDDESELRSDPNILRYELSTPLHTLHGLQSKLKPVHVSFDE
jgi:hypothetical protein